MYATTYHRPATLAEAETLMKTANAKALAGGQTLIPTMKQRLASPEHLVDLTRLPELKGIKVGGGAVTIGAATKHAAVAGSAEVKASIPALAKLAGGIGDPAVRAMGTIGGSLANDDPTADYPAGALGLGATINTSRRAIAADAFFKGMFATALEDGEIIVSVSFPVPMKAAYAKVPNPASRYAMAGVFVAKLADGSVRVAVTGAGSNGVFRHTAMETALAANWSPAALAGVATPASLMTADIHGPAEYRAALVKAMAEQAVAAAG
jgi:carbon-monoxide dehydrogenase medium subunit